MAEEQHSSVSVATSRKHIPMEENESIKTSLCSAKFDSLKRQPLGSHFLRVMLRYICHTISCIYLKYAI